VFSVARTGCMWGSCANRCHAAANTYRRWSLAVSRKTALVAGSRNQARLVALMAVEGLTRVGMVPGTDN